MNKFRKIGLILACGGGLAACQDLDVANPNTPALNEALATPLNVETAVSSAFKQWHSQTLDVDFRQGVSGWMTVALAGNADELTEMVPSRAYDVVVMEPKQPIEHRDAGFWLNRTPWLNYHAAIGWCNDIIEVLDAGMKLGEADEQYPNGRNTDRARWLCTFVNGAAHAYIASIYDRGFILEPGVERDIYSTDFKTPAEINAYAITKIEEAISIAKASVPDETPTTWINGQSYTRDEMVQVFYSYLARIRAFNARNTAERAAVDWTKVIADIDRGIQDDFHPVLGSPLAGRSALCPTVGLCGGAFVWQADRTIRGTTHGYRVWMSTNANSNPRVNQAFLGPGDVSGAWRWWEAQNPGERKDTVYVSPDKRIQMTTPTSAGRYFSRSTSSLAANNGPAAYSRYLWSRMGIFSNNGYRDSLNSSLWRTEMDLLKAEGLIRTGRAAEAVPIINKTRVGVPGTAAGSYGGNLPPVTIAGPPEAADCVPKRLDGSCGDLFDALMWEKRLEVQGSDPIVNWSDWRAWGKFRVGTWLHMPIHSRELYALGIPYYTFGGSLPGSVGAPGTPYP